MLHLIDICFITCMCLWQTSNIQTCLCVCGSRTWISVDIDRFYEGYCQPSSGSAWPTCPKTVIGPPLLGSGGVDTICTGFDSPLCRLESRLSSKSKNPCIQNYTTVRNDHTHGHRGGFLISIHRSITLSKELSDPHLEELTIKADIGNTKLIISNIYIPPTSSCSNGYQSSI